MTKTHNTAQPDEPPLENGGKNNNAQGIQLISRAADILRVLKVDNGGLSLGQIANRVNLPRSTVQRIVNALIVEKLVMSSASEGGLRLGPEIPSLAMAFKLDIVEVLRPVLTELSHATGETVDLAVLRNNQLEFIDQVEGSYRLRAVSAVGEVFPLTDTANGKAVLGLMATENATVLMKKEFGNNSEAKIDELLQELTTIQDQGYSLDRDEHTSGISAVGAAFADQIGVLHAISIPVPTQRFNEKKDQLITSILHAVDQTKNIIA